MALSSIWIIKGIDARGADLLLSRIVPWGINGALTPISINSSLKPVDGLVSDLILDNHSLCRFASNDVYQPGFFISFEFAEPVDIFGFRFAGPSPQMWLYRHQISDGFNTCTLEGVPWVDSNLSPKPTKPLNFMSLPDTWVGNANMGSRAFRGCGVSADGKTILALYRNSAPFLSSDGGLTWVVASGAGTSSDWAGCAISDDVSVIACAPNGGYLRLSADGGATWTQVTSAGSRNWQQVYVSRSGQCLIAAGGIGQLWVSTDRGVNWVNKGSGSLYWRSCAISDDGLVSVALSSSGASYITYDGWVTRTLISSVNAWNGNCASMSADASVILICNDSGALLSKDGGASWVSQAYRKTAGNVPISCVVSTDGSVLMVGHMVGGVGYVSVSYNAGETWIDEGLPAATSAPNQVSTSSDGYLSVGGVYAGFLYLKIKPDPIYIPNENLHVDCLHQIISIGLTESDDACCKIVDTISYGDMEFGGNGIIYGTVKLQTQYGEDPLLRRVRLHRSRDGLLVRETWSDAQGNYRFDGLSTRYEYDVIAWDHEGQFRSTIANNLKPEVLP